MRSYLGQPSGTITRTRALRKDATDAEKRMWQALRLTFPAAKLAVEVDGGQHSEAASYDARRTNFLKAQGLTVLRFWNSDVLANTQGVLEQISLSLREGEGATKLRKGEGDNAPPSNRKTPSPSQG